MNIKHINPKNYTLTFSASGISVFVTDIHREVYKQLKVLFTIENGYFKQYFTNRTYQKASEEGFKFYYNTATVKRYKIELVNHIKNFKTFFSNEIRNKPHLDKFILKKYFKYTTKLCKDYTKMNVEYTDKAYQAQDNKTIQKNLKSISSFKDKVRIFMNMVLFEPTGYTNTIFKTLEKQFNIHTKYTRNLTQKEILNLFDSKKINRKKISKRQKAFVEIWNKSTPIEGDNARYLIQRFKKQKKQTNLVRGQVANKGKTEGRVVIISANYKNPALLKRKIKQMKKGEVLISETTSPELILACKKASAIVTNLGGLMSHAAIISRELGIPCIIGTKIATQVFKNGNKVEVNANTGIIKLIKKN